MAPSGNLGKRFVWNEALNVIFCREILIHRPYQFRAGSKESSSSWDGLVETLTGDDYKAYNFQAKPKSMQDHLKVLMDNRRRVVADQERQSGTVVEDREIDQLLDNIISDRNDCLEMLNEKLEAAKTASALEQAKAEDTRQKAMETMGQTKKRKAEDDTTPRKARRTGSEAMAFMAERSAERQRMQEEEMKLRREELEERKRASEASQNTVLQMMRSMHDQQKQQFQQQQQQFQLQMQQNQQQSVLFAALIEKLNK